MVPLNWMEGLANKDFNWVYVGASGYCTVAVFAVVFSTTL